MKNQYTVIAINVKIPISSSFSTPSSDSIRHLLQFSIHRKTSTASARDEVDANFSCISIKYSIHSVYSITVGDGNMIETNEQILHFIMDIATQGNSMFAYACRSFEDRSVGSHCFVSFNFLSVFRILSLPSIRFLSYKHARARIHE